MNQKEPQKLNKIDWYWLWATGVSLIYLLVQAPVVINQTQFNFVAPDVALFPHASQKMVAVNTYLGCGGWLLLTIIMAGLLVDRVYRRRPAVVLRKYQVLTAAVLSVWAWAFQRSWVVVLIFGVVAWPILIGRWRRLKVGKSNQPNQSNQGVITWKLWLNDQLKRGFSRICAWRVWPWLSRRLTPTIKRQAWALTWLSVMVALTFKTGYPYTNWGDILSQDLMIYVNLVLALGMFWLLWSLLNRYWWALNLTILWFVGFNWTSMVMQTLRNTTVLPADMMALKNADGLSHMVPKEVLLVLLIGLVLVAGVSYALTKLQVGKSNRAWRGVMLVCGGVVYLSPLIWNHQQYPLSAFLSNQCTDYREFFDQGYGAKINGAWAQFLNNIDVHIMDEPKGYSKQAMARVEQRYVSEARQINQTRHQRLNHYHVVYNLSESFADPRRVPGVSYRGQAIPHIRQIKQISPSGLMMSTGFGGGTANMEFMALTSLPTANLDPTLATPYTQIVPKQSQMRSSVAYNWNVKHTTGIHLYNGTFYDRDQDYPKLGIGDFKRLDGQGYDRLKYQHKIDHSGYLSDQTAYANTWDQLKRGGTHGQFINLVTMQNHMPYDHEYDRVDHWHADNQSGTDNDEINQYLTGIHYTDQAAWKFYHQVQNSAKPIVWVFYGDHLPGFYNNSMQIDGLKMHQTDYFIYLNPAAQRLAGVHESASKICDPSEFTAMTLKLTNSQVSPYQALQTRTLTDLPVKTTRTQADLTNQYSGNLQWIDAKSGTIVKHPHFNKQQKQLIHDYKLVEYDQVAGKHYLNRAFWKTK